MCLDRSMSVASVFDWLNDSHYYWGTCTLSGYVCYSFLVLVGVMFPWFCSMLSDSVYVAVTYFFYDSITLEEVDPPLGYDSKYQIAT